jgi:alpha-tubulin suppressor-like RCC1 family protein
MMHQQLRMVFSLFLGALLCALLSVAHADLSGDRAEGIAWLLQNQNGDGSWGQGGTKVAATAEALAALRNAGADNGFIFSRALSWLANARTDSVDALSRKIGALELAGFDTQQMGLLTELVANRNNYAWGAFNQYRGGFPDTALAMEAIRISNVSYADTANSLATITSGKPSGDNGWSYSTGSLGQDLPKKIMPTAWAIITLSEYKKLGHNVTSAITGGVNWLMASKQQGNGSFLDDAVILTGAVHKTALAYLALSAARDAGVEPAGIATSLADAQGFLLAQQSTDGSWNNDAYQTALALRTLPAVTLADADLDGLPDVVEWQIDPVNGDVDARELIPGNGLTSDLSAGAVFIEVLVQQAVPNVSPASGGVAPYNWSLASGVLPPGVSAINADGSFSGVPTVAGVYQFTLSVQDAALASVTVPGYIRVIAADDNVTDTDEDGVLSRIELFYGTNPLDPESGSPFAFDDATNLKVNSPVNIAVLGNDLYANLANTTIVSVTAAGHGMASIGTDGKSIDYLPDTDYLGSDSFNYTIEEDSRQSIATVSIVVESNNPIANADTATTATMRPVSISVLANDSDPDGDAISVSSVSAALHGSVSIASDSLSVSYTSAPGYTGTDNFSYEVSDGLGGTAIAAVTVTVVDTDSESRIEMSWIAGGLDHSLVLKRDGTVWAWGNGANGALGTGYTASSSYPLQVVDSGLLPFYGVGAVASGTTHSIAVMLDDTLFTWGDNTNGQLGDGTATQRLNPVQVMQSVSLPFTDVKSAAGGSQFTAALKNDGTVWAWGRNDFGNLGNGTTTQSYYPVAVQRAAGGALGNIKSIVAGSSHVVALMDDGTVWAWGKNQYGQLGDGTTTEQHAAVQVRDSLGLPLVDIVAIAAGDDHTVGLKRNGDVFAWGRNDNGQLGDGTLQSSSYPVQILEYDSGLPMAAVQSIAADGVFTTVVKQDGTVWAWGGNAAGQLGVGSTLEYNRAVNTVLDTLDPIQGVVAVTSGSDFVISLKADGSLWSWGNNAHGQLSDGTTINRYYPVQVLYQGPSGDVEFKLFGYEYLVPLFYLLMM